MRSWLKLWFAPRCLLMAPISPHWSYRMMQTSLKFPHHKQHLLPPDPTPNGPGMDPLGYLTWSFVPLALRPCDRCNVRMMHWCMHIECIGSFTLHFQVWFQWDRFQNRSHFFAKTRGQGRAVCKVIFEIITIFGVYLIIHFVILGGNSRAVSSNMQHLNLRGFHNQFCGS